MHVKSTSALEKSGIDAVIDAVDGLIELWSNNGWLASQRKEQRLRQLDGHVHGLARLARWNAASSAASAWTQLQGEVAANERHPLDAAQHWSQAHFIQSAMMELVALALFIGGNRVGSPARLLAFIPKNHRAQRPDKKQQTSTRCVGFDWDCYVCSHVGTRRLGQSARGRLASLASQPSSSQNGEFRKYCTRSPHSTSSSAWDSSKVNWTVWKNENRLDSVLNRVHNSESALEENH